MWINNNQCQGTSLDNSFFSELKRRNVFKVAIAYMVVGWLAIQVIVNVTVPLSLPDWAPSLVIVLLAIGFPIALIFAWAFELTPEGIKKSKDVDQDNSISHLTSRKIDLIIIGALLLIIGGLVYERMTNIPAVESQVAEDLQPLQKGVSIAVLPFADMSPENNQIYFSDGISDEILNVLAQVKGLHVTSRSSAFQFRGNDIHIPTVAETLGVEHILEGSVRKSGNNIRITAQLIEAASDKHLWSATFDRALTTENIFAIQSDISNAIVKALSAELDLDEVVEDINVAMATKHLTAYEAFLEGREKFLSRSSFQNVMDSVELLEHATEIDPNFAVAWQWLSAAYAVLPAWAETDRLGRNNYVEYTIKAKEAAERALVLNPDLAFAYGVLGFVASDANPPRWVESIEKYKTALQMNPNDATLHLWIGIDYRNLGYFKLAAKHFSKCIQISPVYINCYSHGWINARFQGDRDKIIEYSEKGMTLSNHHFANHSAKRLRAIVTAVKNDNMYAAYHLLSYWTNKSTGFPTQQWFDAIRNPDKDNSEVIQALADWLEHQNLPDSAKAEFYFSLGAWEHVPLYESDTPDLDIWSPEIKEFRKSNRFKAIIRNLQIDKYWRNQGFPPQCRPIGEDDFECD